MCLQCVLTEWPMDICWRLLVRNSYMAITVGVCGGWPCLFWMSGDFQRQSQTWAVACIELYGTTWCVWGEISPLETSGGACLQSAEM